MQPTELHGVLHRCLTLYSSTLLISFRPRLMTPIRVYHSQGLLLTLSSEVGKPELVTCGASHWGADSRLSTRETVCHPLLCAASQLQQACLSEARSQGIQAGSLEKAEQKVNTLFLKTPRRESWSSHLAGLVSDHGDLYRGREEQTPLCCMAILLCGQSKGRSSSVPTRVSRKSNTYTKI